MNSDVIYKMSKFAFVCALIGVLTIGILPPLAAAGIAVPLTLKKKNANLSEDVKRLNRNSLILGVAALVMCVIDLVAAILIVTLSK